MIASVIVDVPSRQTDRPFDYKVPAEMRAWIETGSRVGVPFGGRVVQGFVVAVSEQTEMDPKRLKAIAELLDPTPPLRADLIELAEWISRKYVCTWTAALQAMIPGALKGKAERSVRFGAAALKALSPESAPQMRPTSGSLAAAAHGTDDASGSDVRYGHEAAAAEAGAGAESRNRGTADTYGAGVRHEHEAAAAKAVAGAETAAGTIARASDAAEPEGTDAAEPGLAAGSASGAGASGASEAGVSADMRGAFAALPSELVRELLRHGSIRLAALQERYPHAGDAVKSALRQGLLEEQTAIRDRLSVRKVLAVYPPPDRPAAEEALAALPKRAGKQREVLAFALDLEEPLPLQALLAETGASAGSVRALADKGMLDVREIKQERDPYAGREFVRTEPLPLTPGQQEVFERVAAAVDAESPQTFLLHGVTGSGKTEVYMQSIQHCLEQGKQAIVLVPEISLTPQMVERFKGRFGDMVAVLHSRLSNGERYDEWRKIRERRVEVAIGARSAVFAPFERIGLIVIDEEHESSYKQEETPKYHARDVAVRRAKQHGAVVVLGSATPSLETYAAAVRSAGPDGRPASLLPLPERVGARPMPPVAVVDMRQELKGGNRSMFSRALHEGLAARLERGEQSVLLLNRRGYSTFVMCRSCGYTATCPHCDITLTYHQRTRALRCHYCGHAEMAPRLCPSCGSEHIRYFGAGTQRVEEELAKLFPGIRVIRMDVDTTTEKGSHEKWLKLFGERKADVLLGTQMVAKGLDFPYVTLVGVIAADTSLGLPDFRAGERTFQLLTQVAGRAGRHHLPGEVVVQTYTPEHYAIQTAQQHDYETFVQDELKHRRMMGYPPFCRLILVTMSHEQLPLLSSVSERFAARLRELAALSGVLGSVQGPGQRAMELLGPVASPISRMKDRYRFQCMIKYRGNIDASGLIREALASFTEGAPKGQVQFSVDVDPHMIL
ncbi:primosomal protein N' [Paenibacillus beijingensis]|uniref:Replication restart protein PriA n=1 Tax=Paenibacillus beijingensis TaxID=1126833 RepID=A0A0D5NMF5_9BACL|nr:primosomal protein N' [Paenibacillus beijingensis]AJY76456.1 primosomal protein DnaI [Paenibacillus beijingensis]